ncbi:hypothetical protein A3860_10020 [Niastella vici]|uniref:Uncharacterized protein n=1 Tax=Niastella vici TaxID=1703345 RepID=A0A1V9FF45_9BACT|nr:hypothetical protein [Niastella vici]OQP56907.1 hypothetical protein A3860_10020 [Niastella vici]
MKIDKTGQFPLGILRQFIFFIADNRFGLPELMPVWHLMSSKLGVGKRESGGTDAQIGMKIVHF